MISPRQMAHYVALHHPDFSILQYQALNQVLIDLLADILKIEPNPEEIEKEKTRFCFRLKLLTEKDWEEWLLRNHLTAQEFYDLMCKRSQARLIHQSYMQESVPWKRIKFLLDNLKMHDCYETWLEKAAYQEKLFQAITPYYQEFEHSELMDEKEKIIKTHSLESSWSPDITHEEWAEEAGFCNLSECKAEMLKAKIVRDYLASSSFSMTASMETGEGP